MQPAAPAHPENIVFNFNPDFIIKTQNPLVATPWGFKSLLRHRFSTKKRPRKRSHFYFL